MVKNKHLSKIIVLTSSILVMVLIGCELASEQLDPLGSITGRVVLSDGSPGAGVIVTLEKREAGRTVTIAKVLSGTREASDAHSFPDMTTTDEHGIYTFSQVEEGEYNIYAVFPDKSNANVTTILVEEAEDVVVPSLQLSLAGTLSGRVIVNETETGNGEIYVYLAGTSFNAVTDDAGCFTLYGVPSGIPFDVKVYCEGSVQDWQSVTLSSGLHTDLGSKSLDVSGDSENQMIVWKGSLVDPPENPEPYWAYHNTSDGSSYLYNGTDWDLLAQGGEDGSDGETPVFIVFKENGATSGYLPQTILGYEGDPYTIPGNTRDLARRGYHFSHWNTDPSGSGDDYEAGEQQIFTASQIELYAIWEPNIYTATLDANGGTLEGVT